MQYQRRIVGRFSEGTENGDNGSEELQLQQENGNVENVAEPDNNKADEGAGQAQTDFTDDANAAGDFSAGDASEWRTWNLSDCDSGS